MDELNATKLSVTSELSSQEPAQAGRSSLGHPPPALGHGRGTPGQRVATGRRSRTLLVGHRRQSVKRAVLHFTGQTRKGNRISALFLFN